MAVHAALERRTTNFPDSDEYLDSGAPELNEQDWLAVAYDCWQMLTFAIGKRTALETNLRDYQAIYELDTGRKNLPYVDASDVFIPVATSKFDALLSQIVAKTLVPEFYIITGLDADAGTSDSQVQRYYNNELRKGRGQSSWFNEYVQLIAMSLRDGTSIMECLWKTSRKQVRITKKVPQVGPDGMPVFEEGTNKIVRESTTDIKWVTTYDACDLKAILLKEFLILPDEATSIESAPGCARVCWMMEDEMRAMIKSPKNPEGVFSEHWVEQILKFAPQGTNDVDNDRQGSYDKSAGGQIDVGGGNSGLVSKFFRNRGPFKIYRIHCNVFDMDLDKRVEENVYWIHDVSGFMAGWCPAEYLAPERPFFAFSPFPRWDRFYGYSFMERAAGIQSETNLLFNNTNDEVHFRLRPIILYNRNEEIHDKGHVWKPGAEWPVSNTRDAVVPLQLQDIPASSIEMQNMLNNYLDQVSGMAPPMVGAPNTGRRSATEMKIAAASTGTRSDLTAMLFRMFAVTVLRFIHAMNLQYFPDDDEDLPEQDVFMNKATLAKKYKLDVAGIGDPLDMQSVLQTVTMVMQFLSKDPDVMGDPVKMWNLKRKFLEAVKWTDIEAVIGTEEEAKAEKQAKQQQAQEAAQFQKMQAMVQLKNEMASQPQKPHPGTHPGANGKPPAQPPQQQPTMA